MSSLHHEQTSNAATLSCSGVTYQLADSLSNQLFYEPNLECFLNIISKASEIRLRNISGQWTEGWRINWPTDLLTDCSASRFYPTSDILLPEVVRFGYVIIPSDERNSNKSNSTFGSLSGRLIERHPNGSQIHAMQIRPVVAQSVN